MNLGTFSKNTSNYSINYRILLIKLIEIFIVFSRHFIVLIASTPIKDQYTDWVRLVESKIRHLVLSLEKNQHISMAHVNPQGYQQTKEV